MSLVDDLIRAGNLKTEEIINAFRKIKREDFVLSGDKPMADINAPLPIGFNQTISQPLTVAFMLELLGPEKGDKILDVGCGSGWTTALLAEIVGAEGKVYGIEIIGDLKKFGEKNVAKYNFIERGIVRIILADGRAGLPQFAPFDKILVSAASLAIPRSFLEQLREGGRLVMPLGRQYESQEIIAVDRIGKNDFQEERHPGFIFVPLVKK